ncbi:MAG: hypothetical protein L0Z50_31980 [Verrucomicrobiales bacterium]|nr:hypothetical protein [Verrucomicrobiales bacterium]
MTHKLFLKLAAVTLSLAPWLAAASPHDVIVNATIDMTCFPPPPPPSQAPGIGASPPCALPSRLDPRFVSPNPSGRARLIVKDDDTAIVAIDLSGLAPNLVMTAWAAYYFPPGPTPHPIFDRLAPGLPPVAAVSAPLAPTRAGFTSGLGREPNQFVTHGDKAWLRVHLDYNPLKAGQGPLRNEASLITQLAAPADSGAEQPLCCPNGFPVPQPQPIGAAFLRVFDPATGFQLKEPDGRPMLLRSPVPTVVIAVVVHIDDSTHGISAGIPIPPAPGIPATSGDHFTLGLFDLRQFHLE